MAVGDVYLQPPRVIMDLISLSAICTFSSS